MLHLPFEQIKSHFMATEFCFDNLHPIRELLSNEMFCVCAVCNLGYIVCAATGIGFVWLFVLIIQ